MITGRSGADCRILVLGPAAVRPGDELHPLRGQQGEVLCALAARFPDPVPADQLIDLLWPEGAPRTARTGLGVVVHRLRDRWDDTDFIVNEAGCYRLAVAPDDIDSMRFEKAVRDAMGGNLDPALAAQQLSAALELWRGDAFQPFDQLPPLTSPAAQLHELRRDAEEVLVDCLLNAGEPDDAAMLASRFVDTEPYRERRWQQLMLALYRTGRQAEALRTGQRAANLLRDELGIEPGAGIRELESAILDQSPSLAGPKTPELSVAQFVASIRQAPDVVPKSSNSFIGRLDELTLVGKHLDEGSQVTIIGPAGSGKSRLAAEFARGAADRRVLWLDLVPLTGDGMIVELASALGVRATDADPTNAIAHALRAEPTLLVFDNCEHLVNAAAAVSSALLASCPELRILATSRVALSAQHEVRIELAPLTPDESRQLLLDRAYGGMMPSDQIDVSRVVQLVDGIPLFLELVAPALATVSPSQVADELVTSLSSAGGQDRHDERHRTLSRALDWSIDLLDDATTATYEALGVMRGLFRVSDVCALLDSDPATVRAQLHTLTDHFLLVADKQSTDATFRQLESTRAHARSRLVAQGRFDELERHHAHIYSDLAATLRPSLEGPDEEAAANRLTQAIDQLSAAHRYLVADPAETERAAALVNDLFGFSFMRQHYSHYRWPEDVLAMSGIEQVGCYVELLSTASLLAWARDDFDRAEALADDALQLAAERGDQPPLLALRSRLNVVSFRGQLSEAVTSLMTLIGESERQNDDRELAVTLVSLTIGQTQAGMHVESRQAANRGLALAEAIGNPSTLAWSHYAAGVAEMVHQPQDALRHFSTAIRLARQVNNRFVQGMAMGSLAVALRRQDRSIQAVDMLADVIAFWGRAQAAAQIGFLAKEAVLVLSDLGERENAAKALSFADRFDRVQPLLGDDYVRYEALAGALRNEFGFVDLGTEDDVTGPLVGLLRRS